MSTKTDVRWLAEDAAELEAIACVVSGVAGPRALALDVVQMLVVLFTTFCSEAWYARVNGELLTLLSWARVNGGTPEGVQAADRLASFHYVAGGMSEWPKPHQVAHDIATALRRACESEPDLALILRDAKRLLVWARKDPKRVDELVARAMREAVAA